MNRASPTLRDFAKRLISEELIDNNNSASKPPAIFPIIENLRPCLAQIIGNLGFAAVLSRALSIAKTDVAWLCAVHVKPDGSLEGPDELAAKVGPEEIAEGGVVLVAQFISLLVELIGERIVLQLVHQAMPQVSKEDLYFNKGI